MNFNNQLAPIIIFAYNRPEIFEKTLKALSQNLYANESEVFIFCDGAKEELSEEELRKIRLVRELAHKQNWCKKLEVHESEVNKGLAKSIIEGVTQMVNKYGKVIVFEDDLITSPYTLEFLNNGLNQYQNNHNVASIHAYNYPIKSNENDPETFFIKGADCWGWATWDRAWAHFNNDSSFLFNQLKSKKLEFQFDFEGGYDYMKLLESTIINNRSSWAINWYASAFLNNMLTLYPKKSLINHIGIEGTNSNYNGKNKLLDILEIYKKSVSFFPGDISENKEMKQKMIDHFIYYKNWKPNVIQSSIFRIRNITKKIFKFK